MTSALHADRARRRAAWYWGGMALALVLGGWLRWPAVFAAYPYLTYVDEGHLLHPARETLATGVWAPDHNNYPQLPVRAIATAARLLSPLAGRWPIAPRTADAKADMDYYDQVEPPQLILVGRLLSWLLGLGIVALSGALARRLAGDRAGLVAALAAALLPALVLRGAAVAVDPYATLFVLGALYCLPLPGERQVALRAALAGACCGCAAISKYPAGLVIVAVAAGIAGLPQRTARKKLAAILGAGAGAGLAAAILMPSTWRQPATVWGRIAWQGSIYSSQPSPTLWQQAFRQAEWDLAPVSTPELGWVFVLLAAAGFAILLHRERTRPWAIGAAVFVGLLIALHSQYAFQAFRNLLPAAGLGCVPFGAAAAALGERLGPRLAVTAAAALLLALFVPAGLAFRADRGRLVDSRRQAVEWLLANRGEGERLLVLAETAIPRLELDRLKGRVRSAPWEEARAALRTGGPRFVLAAELTAGGALLIPAEDRAWLLERYRLRADFGEHPADAAKYSWRGNRLRVRILERVAVPSLTQKTL